MFIAIGRQVAQNDASIPYSMTQWSFPSGRCPSIGQYRSCRIESHVFQAPLIMINGILRHPVWMSQPPSSGIRPLIGHIQSINHKSARPPVGHGPANIMSLSVMFSRVVKKWTCSHGWICFLSEYCFLVLKNWFLLWSIESSWDAAPTNTWY